jgi:hypothetical protein
MRLFPAICLLLILSGSALAQSAQMTRVLRTFDFEERKLGNVEDLPMNWVKVEGAGLPHYVNARLSSARHRSGQYSFEFNLDGGGLIYRYPAGLLAVRQGAHYSVRTYVQTTPLPNARARLTAYLADMDGRPILASVRHSPLFANAASDNAWHSIGVEITDDTPDAASLVIELELLQPAQYSASTLGERQLFAEDIHGTAWFDDLSVSQVPEVFMTTDRPGGMFRHSDPLRLLVLVSDLFTDDLTAQLFVRDAAGNQVYQNTAGLALASAPSESPGQKRITILLPDNLGTGWYQANLMMYSGRQFVCRQALNFVRLADDAPPVLPDQRFGVNAADLSADGWSQLPGLLPTIGAGRVKLSVWNSSSDSQSGEHGDFDHLLQQLSDEGIVPTACLVDLPSDIKQKLNGGSWTTLLSADPQLWKPQLAYLVARHADHLQRWQIGEDGSDAFVQAPQMRDVYALIYGEFAKLMDRPDLAMPWPAWYELSGDSPATVALFLKPEVLPSQIPLYVNEIKPASSGGFLEADTSPASANGLSPQRPRNLSLYLEPIDRQRYGREVQIADFAQRIGYALSAEAERIDVKLPFRIQHVGDHIMSQPDELLLVTRTMMTTLAGAKFCGKVPLATGVEAFLFNKDEQGIILLWDRGSSAAKLRRLSLNLGEHPRSIDMWGNTTPLLASAPVPGAGVGEGEGRHNEALVEVGSMPIFLVDVDVYIAQMRASMNIDDPKVESSFKPHIRHIRFVNPYHQAVSGSVHLRAPAGWTLNPPSFTFALNPGETMNKEVSIEFPYNSFAGSKILWADVNLQADKANTFSVPITLKLGLSDVGLQTLALRDGADVLVEQMITNYGDKPINYTAYATFPGSARQERMILNLNPGVTIMKKYRFPNATITPDSKARSGLKETDGIRMLNNEVAVQ